MAAADGLRLLFDALDGSGQILSDDTRRIICELHEDWAACDGDDVELVSAKHREPSYGAYTTIEKLLTDGGLVHLFGRWCALKETPTCRLVTTAGLGSGPAQDLEKATTWLRAQRASGTNLSTDTNHGSVITEFARGLLRHPSGLPAEWRDSTGANPTTPSEAQRRQTARFLSVLSLDHGRPRRVHVPYAAPSMYAKPVLVRMGHPNIPPEAAWAAVLGLFRERMRAAGPLPHGGLPAVLAYRRGTLPESTAAERQLAARIVYMSEISLAVRVAISHPKGYIPIRRHTPGNRMAIKMEVGTCADNTIERADQLRKDYVEHWRTRIGIDHTARAERDQMRRALLRISDDATAIVSRQPEPWGPQFWRELQAQLDRHGAEWWPSAMETDLRLGGICDLANRCQVWFSQKFDIDAELARRREGQG